MLQKLAEKIASNKCWKQQYIGAVVLIICISISYTTGKVVGRANAVVHQPQLTSLTQKIDKIEAAMAASRECSNIMLNTVHREAK
jgi:hypothetical protein